ncbi:hypothetical protein LY78DRAFT_694672 [Colletotrichum sublineola]|nr:hypothetical protein LY78DRAFT_694672 [Colletotrichum sublineola]
MKGTKTSALVLSGLAALTRAREVKVDEVPVECATICGPIVELTFKCDIDGSFDELKRRNLDGPPTNPLPPERRQARKPYPGGRGHEVARRHHHRRPAQDGVVGGGRDDGGGGGGGGDHVSHSEDVHITFTTTAAFEYINILDAYLDYKSLNYKHFDKYIHDEVHDYKLCENEHLHDDKNLLHHAVHNEFHDNKYPDNEHSPATSGTSGTPTSPAGVHHIDRLPDDATTSDNGTDPGSATGTVYSSNIRSATGDTTTSTAAIIHITVATTAPGTPYAASPNIFIVVIAVDSLPALIHSADNAATATAHAPAVLQRSRSKTHHLDIIMAQCNFSGADYTPGKDRLVDFIHVQAQKPSLAGAGRFKSGSAAAAAALVSLVAGMALFL